MKALLTAILALALPQEDPEELVRKLGDELIEVREETTEKLIRLGEKSRDAVTKASGSADAEIRVRAERVLKTLDLHRELRLWLGLPSKITLSGEHTLESACRELERQSGQKVTGQSWPEGKFRIDLKEVPFWDAVESICAASGQRSALLTSTGVSLGGEKYVRHPSQSSGAFFLKVGSVERGRTFHFRTGTSEESLSMSLTLGWERSIAPVRSFLDVQVAEDDLGLDLVPGFGEYENRITAGGAYAVADPKPVFSEEYHLKTLKPPDAKAGVLNRFSGRVVLWIRAAHGDIELKIPEAGAESELSVPILDRELNPASKVRVTLGETSKSDSSFNATLAFEGADPRMLKWNTNLWHVVDQKGRKYPGMSMGYRQGETRYSVRFRGLALDSEPSKVVIRIPPRVLQMEIPFSIKDIPVQ